MIMNDIHAVSFGFIIIVYTIYKVIVDVADAL